MMRQTMSGGTGRHAMGLAPVPQNTLPIQANVANVQAVIDYDQLAIQLQAGHDSLYPPVDFNDPSYSNIKPHDFVFGRCDQSSGGIDCARNGGQGRMNPSIQSSLTGFDGYNGSLAQLGRELRERFPSTAHALLIDRILSQAVDAQVCFVGVAQTEGYFALPGQAPKKELRNITVAVHGVNGSTAEKFIRHGQFLRLRAPTPQELEQRRDDAFKGADSLVREQKATLIIEPYNARSFAMSWADGVLVWSRHPELYARIFDAYSSRIGRAEILAVEQVKRVELLKGLRFTGGLLDAGLIRLNAPVGADGLAAQAAVPFNDRIPAAPVVPDGFSMPRAAVPDFNVHPQLLLTPYVRAAGDGRRAAWGDVTPTAARAAGFAATPITATDVVTASSSVAFEVLTAELLNLIRPSHSSELGQHSGMVQQFLQDPVNEEAAMALRTFLLNRMTIPGMQGESAKLRLEPGAFITTTGAVGNPNYRLVNNQREPNDQHAGGRYLRAAQIAETSGATGMGQKWMCHSRNHLGTAMNSASPGNMVTYMQTRNNTA